MQMTTAKSSVFNNQSESLSELIPWTNHIQAWWQIYGLVLDGNSFDIIYSKSTQVVFMVCMCFIYSTADRDGPHIP